MLRQQEQESRLDSLKKEIAQLRSMIRQSASGNGNGRGHRVRQWINRKMSGAGSAFASVGDRGKSAANGAGRWIKQHRYTSAAIGAGLAAAIGGVIFWRHRSSR